MSERGNPNPAGARSPEKNVGTAQNDLPLKTFDAKVAAAELEMRAEATSRIAATLSDAKMVEQRILSLEVSI